MNKILLNFGLILDKYKLEERKHIFKDYQHLYYFPNYLIDSKTNTLFYFDDNDIALINKIFGSNVKIFYYDDLYLSYRKYFQNYVDGARIFFRDKNELELLNDLQEVLNEYVFLLDLFESCEESEYIFLSNSFRFYDNVPYDIISDNNWFYQYKMLYSKDLKEKVNYDLAYGFYKINFDKYKKLIVILKQKINDFFTGSENLTEREIIEFFDYDAERLRYAIFTELNLNPISFRLKKTYYRNFKTFGEKPKLNNIQTGCEKIIKEMYDLR